MLAIFKWLHSNIFGYSYIMPFYHLYKKWIISQFNLKMCIVLKFLSSKEIQKYRNSLYKKENSHWKKTPRFFALFSFFFLHSLHWLCTGSFWNIVLALHMLVWIKELILSGSFAFYAKKMSDVLHMESTADTAFRFPLNLVLDICGGKKSITENLRQ